MDSCLLGGLGLVGVNVVAGIPGVSKGFEVKTCQTAQECR